MAKKMPEIGLDNMADSAKIAKSELTKLDNTLVNLGDKLDDLPNKIKIVSQVITQQKRGVEKVVTTLKAYDEQIKSTLNIKTINDTVKQIKITPEQEKTNKKTRGIVGYEGISQSAELVRAETKLLADGTRQLIEVFKKVDETGTTTYKSVNKKIVDVAKNTQKVNEEQEKTNKKTSKFGILLNRIKTIAIYRAIRRMLQIITQSFTQSISNLAQYDENVNKSVSTITSAFMKMQNVVLVALYPVLEALAPVIDNIANSIAGFANQISLANAQLTGQSTYIALNEDYWKDYAKSVKEANKQLLSFDKFEVLQQGNKTDVSQLFDTKTIDGTEQVSESAQHLVEVISQLPSILNGLLNILNSLWDSAKKLYKDVLKPILPDLLKTLDIIIDIVAWIIKVLDQTGLLETGIGAIIGIGIGSKLVNIISKVDKLSKGLSAIYSIIGLIGVALTVINFKNIIKEWSNWGDTAKAVAVTILALTTALAATAAALLVISGKWAKALAVGGIILGAGTSIALGVGNLIGHYEDGGIPDKSELFYMNEYGKPEAMMNLGGQTNVINQDQLRLNMKQGFVEAIYETGLLEAMQQGIIVEGRNIDNNSVARGLFNALKVESKRRGGNQL